MDAPRVAVIGAGVLGLMAIKNFTEDGFEVTGFESRPYVGGLWKNTNDSSLSVHPTTSFNTSKFRAGISDFPFSDETDDYPTAPQMFEYLQSYSEHFDLTRRIRFNTKVVNLERQGNKWALESQPENGPTRTELFDKVAVATGSYFKPKRLTFEGIEHFAGSNIHAINYHDAEEYKGKNVLIIGLHASAQDTLNSLRHSARKVYMSHRQGLVLLPRYSPSGEVMDTQMTLRFMFIQAFMESWFPRFWTWAFDKLILSVSQKAFAIRPEWKFLPAPSIAVSTPVIGDKTFDLFTSGFATPVSGVSSIIGPRTVKLVDGTVLSDIDAIIQCTGYDFATPVIPASASYQPFPEPGGPPHLYRNIFPLCPDLEVRNSLAFLGQVGIVFPGFVQHELMIQSISQIWQGKSHLPALSEMQKWHRNHIAWRHSNTKRYGQSSTFYNCFVPLNDHIRWLDRTAGTGLFRTFDWAWLNQRSWSLWWNDRDLYRMCMDGLFSPSIWRLFDCGGRKAWSGARNQLIKDNEARKRQAERRLRSSEESEHTNGFVGSNKNS